MQNKLWSILFLALALAGCATSPVNPLREIPPGNPSLKQVRDHLEAFIAKRVRWGGTIISVENRADQTWLEILDRPLDKEGRPGDGGDSLGRFIARLQGFHDPAIYAPGREIAVIGVVDSKLTRPVGQYPYTYVVINAETTKLWERRVATPYYRDFRYDPFYDPFYPGPLNPWYPWYPPYPFYPWR
jgi:outer membrane lipoprotein